MAKRKARKLTKTGRRRTGRTRGSGKRRSDRVAGARPSAKRAAGRKVKRAGRRASSVARPARAGRAADDAGGPSMPLRDLVRGGAPRSPKAHRPPVTDMVTPWTQRRSKTAHGLRSGGTVYQAQQSTRERYGGLKFSVPKRG